MDNQELDEIRARCEAATPGPWKFEEWNLWVNWGDAERDPVYQIDGPSWSMSNISDALDSKPDAEFIAAARTDIPVLLDHIAALTAELERVSQARDEAIQEEAATRLQWIGSQIKYIEQQEEIKKEILNLRALMAEKGFIK